MSTLSLYHISVAVGEKTIISDVSLSVATGEVHVLMGPNGSGKSSLVSAIMGHPKYRIEGQIVVDQDDITGESTDKKAKRGIFLSMQYLPEIPGVTLNNFLYKAYKAQKNSDISILDFYKMAEARAKEIGIDPVFLKRQVGAGLSGGEKKQAEMLQAVVLEPTFMLLDEIDSGVDVDAMKNILAAINWLTARGTGVLVITHYDTILKSITPQHVSVMKEGKIVASGGQELAEQIRDGGFNAI